jgi:hypothetical protein
MDKIYQEVIRRRKSMKLVSLAHYFFFFFIDLRLLITPCYRLSIVLSVLHWFTPSYYPLVSFIHCFVCPSLIYVLLLPLGIFCPLFCLSFIDLRLLITPWYLLSIVLSVLHWLTMDKKYQGVIRRRKSMKDRQNNGQKIPRGNKKT